MRVPILSTLKLSDVWRARWRFFTSSATGKRRDSLAGQTVRHAIHAALLIMIALTLISLWPRKLFLSSTMAVPAAPASVASATLADTIVAAHLFGQTKAAVPKPSLAAPSIRVVGIVYASQTQDSLAVLTLNGKTDVYKDGQTLPDGETVMAVSPTEIQLTENGVTRTLPLPRYGEPESEGPAAYAALLHGTGLSTPETGSAAAMLTTAAPSEPMQPFAPVASVPMYSSAAGLRAPVVQIPASATPLEQLQLLRAQLIHPR